MINSARPPRVLVVDDLFGRRHPESRNEERASLCGQLLLRDVTEAQDGEPGAVRVRAPIAEAVFHRGQQPVASVVGDVVENDLEGCRQVISSGWSDRPDGQPPWAMLLLDLCFYTGRVTRESSRRLAGMPEGRPGDDDPESYFGLEVLRAARLEFPDLPIVILSSKRREAVARAIAAQGALGFIARGESDARETLREYLWRHGLLPDQRGEIIGHSVSLLKALRSARRAGISSRSILLRGEPGTGKELLASYVHTSSPDRSEGPFVVVDSGALSVELFASELFGHMKGAFTGAQEKRTGRVVRADGGDLFLDEIANMPPDVQVGLLRVLQERQVFPVGGEQGIDVDVRFLAATNEDVEGKALLGRFRADLLDRLRMGGTINLPPLRERREDIPVLVEHFFEEARTEVPGGMLREVVPEAIEHLAEYDWPGNVRALESCVRRAVASHPDVEYLYPHHFDLPRHQTIAAPAPHVHADNSKNGSPGVVGEEEHSLQSIIETLRSVSCAEVPAQELAGSLERLERAYARFGVRLLAAALRATRNITPENPAGEVKISPAVKLLTGRSNLTSNDAADLVNWLLSFVPDEAGQVVDEDADLLEQAREMAVKLRGERRAPGPKARQWEASEES